MIGTEDRSLPGKEEADCPFCGAKLLPTESIVDGSSRWRTRMTVYASGSAPQTFGYQADDGGYVPKSMLHYIENTGATKLRYLELWQSDHFPDVSLAQWLAFTPYELVKAHLNIDKSVLSKVSTQKTPVAGL
jgi:oxalate decarboxylase/phosphoglucose isomerase-like protein (cupin superfamily)